VRIGTESPSPHSASGTRRAAQSFIDRSARSTFAVRSLVQPRIRRKNPRSAIERPLSAMNVTPPMPISVSGRS
jgi:hypothetical protein